MSILKIRTYGDPVLRQETKEISEISPEIHELIDDMIHTMRIAPGIGLAAPQVGKPIKLIIVTMGLDTNQSNIIALINPVITWCSDEFEIMEEGCLSIPDTNADVKRYREITVQAIDENGEKKEWQLYGLDARVAQHEIDHINGTLFIDRLPPLRQDIVKRKLKKKIKRESL